jgi:hypothetical protein
MLETRKTFPVRWIDVAKVAHRETIGSELSSTPDDRASRLIEDKFPGVEITNNELREIVGETFIIPSKTAPTSRAVIEDYLKRSGLDIIPAHEVDNITHAVSMIASTGAVALLPLYPNNLLPWSVTSRPIRGDAPTIDLVLGYNKANRSPILKLFLSRVDDLSARMSSHAR